MRHCGNTAAVAPKPLVTQWLMADDVDDDARKALLLRNPVRTERWHSLGPSSTAPFQAKALLRTDPDLGLMSCFDPAGRWLMREDHPIAQGGGLLIRPTDGTVAIELDGERAICLHREGLVLWPGRAASFTLTNVSRIDCFVLPLASDDLPLLGNCLRRVRHDNGGLVVLGHFAAAVMRGLLPMNSDALNALALQYMSGLVGTMVDEAPLSHAGGRPAAILGAIKAEIEARLDQPDLSVQQIATLQGVTSRYVQKLFKTEGRTFSDYLLERRLERALNLLQNAGASARPVGRIAFDVGFGDLSYFNRTFKKRFGLTPREVRTRSEANGKGPAIAWDGSDR